MKDTVVLSDFTSGCGDHPYYISLNSCFEMVGGVLEFDIVGNSSSQ